MFTLLVKDCPTKKTYTMRMVFTIENGLIYRPREDAVKKKQPQMVTQMVARSRNVDSTKQK